MITKERIAELKELYQKEVDYYGSIDFPILQGKFQTIIDILTEIEEYMCAKEEPSEIEAAPAQEERINNEI